MRIAVLGATGNVGTSVLDALAAEPTVDEIVGIARRPPDQARPKVTWARADTTTDDLTPHLRGADAVIHLAWLIQPSHDQFALWRVNVEGTDRILRATAEAGVPALLYASSIGAYSPGPKDRRVDETWPTHGVPTSSYSRDKAYVERLLDVFERDHPGVRVVRFRPGLVFKRAAAAEIRRYFAGPLLPGSLLHRLPVVPAGKRLRLQGVHAADVGEAFRLAALSGARGAFNLAAEPVLDGGELAKVLGARTVPVPAAALRLGAGASWRLRLQPVDAGWVDLAVNAPLMDLTRARTELGWAPRHTATEALAEVLTGMRDGAGGDTPPLDPDAGGPLRGQEFRTGVGGRP